MSREKQIEEMARDICQNGGTCSLTEWNECNLSVGEYCAKCRTMAERLYNAGYRKQSEGEWNTECIAGTSGGFDWYTHSCSNCNHYYRTILPPRL